jgi:hypothetical protein
MENRTLAQDEIDDLFAFCAEQEVKQIDVMVERVDLKLEQ